MTSLDAETLAAVEQSLEDVFAQGLHGALLRESVHAMGWQEILDADPSANRLLFQAQGAALACSALLDDVVLASLAGELAEGCSSRRVMYVLDSVPSGSPGRSRLRGVLLADLDDVMEVVALDATRPDPVAWSVPARSIVDLVPGAALDRGSEWAVAVADVAGGRALTGDVVTAAVAAGRRAVAAEIIGICQSALDMAIAHTSARQQYGRPLASFQSVRHLLAEAHTAIEAARVTLLAAEGPDMPVLPQAEASRVAKVRAGDTQAIVLRRTVQVLGAMGMTLESDMHRFVTRGAALDTLLGSHGELAEQIANEFIAGREITRLMKL